MIKTRLIKLLAHARKYIVYQVIWQWIALIAQIILMYAAVYLLYGAFTESEISGQPMKTAGYLIMILCGAGVRYICNRQAEYASHQASVDVKQILREKIYEKLLRLGASYKEQISSAEVVQLAGEGVEQLETYFGRFLSQFFYSFLAPLTLFLFLFRVSFKASLVLLVCVPLIPGVIMMVQKIAKRILSKYWDVYTGLSDSFLENLQGMTTLKIYRADKKKAEEMDVESEHFRIITMKVLKMQLNSIIIMDIVAYGGAALGMIITISQYLHGAVDFPGALWIILLSVEFFLPMRLLGSFFHIAMNGMTASDKIFRLLDLPEPEGRTKRISEEKVSMHLDNVHFSYDGNREILHGVTMDFPSGSFTSLVGASGCGKSTVAQILLGRNRGYQGQVTVNGTPLGEVAEESLLDHVTMVTSNSHIFCGSVRRNLTMGNPNATDSQMMEALKKVNLDGFLRSQQGLDTEIAEDGSNISGGQRQRLALARALLHDTPVYVFDEATSNIDLESEEMIMDVIHELAYSHTIILISHRLANVVDSDCIYMLKEGSLEESGTHKELMEKNGPYAHLFLQQRDLEQYGKAVPA